MRKKALACAVIVALLLAASFAQVALERSDLDGGGDGDVSQSQVNYLDFLGGVRQYFAYVLWIRTESLHHGYYGVLGWESELIPYYYLISYLDPHNIDSYYVAGLTIFTMGKEQEAIDFTLQGIANNPDSGDLYASLADLYMRQKQYELAREAYRDALGRQLELLDELYITAGIASASAALDDIAGTISARIEMLDYYRLALCREDLDQYSRQLVIWQINWLSDLIGELQKRIAEPDAGGDN